MTQAHMHPHIPSWAEMAFAERLAALRKTSGLTQQALAHRAGVHVTLLRRYEAGKVQPSIDALRRIAVALSVSADLLLFDEGDRGPADDLRLEFEAMSRLDPDERGIVRGVIESVVLKHDVRHAGVSSSGERAAVSG